MVSLCAFGRACKGGAPKRNWVPNTASMIPRGSERAARSFIVQLMVKRDDHARDLCSFAQSVGSQSVFLAIESSFKGGVRRTVLVAAYTAPRTRRSTERAAGSLSVVPIVIDDDQVPV